MAIILLAGFVVRKVADSGPAIMTELRKRKLNTKPDVHNQIQATIPEIQESIPNEEIKQQPEERQEDNTEGQVQMGVLDLEKRHEASLTTTTEGNKDEKLLYIIIGLIGLLATAAGIAAIPVPENSRNKTFGKICSGLFDILVLILLGAMIILGIYVQISKATQTKHVSSSYVVFFLILGICTILKMVMVAVGDL